MQDKGTGTVIKLHSYRRSFTHALVDCRSWELMLLPLLTFSIFQRGFLLLPPVIDAYIVWIVSVNAFERCSLRSSDISDVPGMRLMHSSGMNGKIPQASKPCFNLADTRRSRHKEFLNNFYVQINMTFPQSNNISFVLKTKLLLVKMSPNWHCLGVVQSCHTGGKLPGLTVYAYISIYSYIYYIRKPFYRPSRWCITSIRKH